MRNEIYIPRRNAFGAKKFYEKSFEDCKNMFFALSFIYWISSYDSYFEIKYLKDFMNFISEAKFKAFNFKYQIFICSFVTFEAVTNGEGNKRINWTWN